MKEGGLVELPGWLGLVDPAVVFGLDDAPGWLGFVDEPVLPYLGAVGVEGELGLVDDPALPYLGVDGVDDFVDDPELPYLGTEGVLGFVDPELPYFGVEGVLGLLELPPYLELEPELLDPLVLGFEDDEEPEELLDRGFEDEDEPLEDREELELGLLLLPGLASKLSDENKKLAAIRATSILGCQRFIRRLRSKICSRNSHPTNAAF